MSKVDSTIKIECLLNHSTLKVEHSSFKIEYHSTILYIECFNHYHSLVSSALESGMQSFAKDILAKEQSLLASERDKIMHVGETAGVDLAVLKKWNGHCSQRASSSCADPATSSAPLGFKGHPPWQLYRGIRLLIYFIRGCGRGTTATARVSSDKLKTRVTQISILILHTVA